MAAIIVRMDDLRRIKIPKEIIDSIGGATEGTQFEIECFSSGGFLVQKVVNTENIYNDIIYLKNHINSPDVSAEFNYDNINKINEKLDEIKNIVYMENYKKKEQ